MSADPMKAEHQLAAIGSAVNDAHAALKGSPWFGAATVAARAHKILRAKGVAVAALEVQRAALDQLRGEPPRPRGHLRSSRT